MWIEIDVFIRRFIKRIKVSINIQNIKCINIYKVDCTSIYVIISIRIVMIEISLIITLFNRFSALWKLY